MDARQIIEQSRKNRQTLRSFESSRDIETGDAQCEKNAVDFWSIAVRSNPPEIQDGVRDYLNKYLENHIKTNICVKTEK